MTSLQYLNTCLKDSDGSRAPSPTWAKARLTVYVKGSKRFQAAAMFAQSCTTCMKRNVKGFIHLGSYLGWAWNQLTNNSCFAYFHAHLRLKAIALGLEFLYCAPILGLKSSGREDALLL